jgi:predicted RNase H-like nuclease
MAIRLRETYKSLGRIAQPKHLHLHKTQCMKAVGIDGCKYGWVAACYDEEQVALFKDINELTARYGNDYTLLIDMPIGLASANSNPRTCETEARKALSGTKKSSIFPVPCREALQERSYPDKHLKDFLKTRESNRNVLGVGISIQSYCIMPKIKEVDDFIIKHPGVRQRLKESHPEIAFQFLNNGLPLLHGKKRPEGIAERLSILANHDNRSGTLYAKALTDYRRYKVAKDDILDALCLALMQQVIAANPDKFLLSSFPANPSLDEQGIEMAIYYGINRPI